MEGVLVASKISGQSWNHPFGNWSMPCVKFESAGIIESRPQGMKGTYIKVRNDVVFEEVRKNGREYREIISCVRFTVVQLHGQLQKCLTEMVFL